MIVFWRLFLSMYMADVILFRKLLKIQAQNRLWATLIRTVVFLVSAFWLCRHYLTLTWPFFGVIDLPGWLCLLLFGAFYAGVHQFFNFGGQIRGGYLLTFFVKNTFLFLFLFLCTGYGFALPISGVRGGEMGIEDFAKIVAKYVVAELIGRLTK